MRILFTTGDNFMSELIREVTNEPCSHCALHLGNFVIHSDLLGLRTETYGKFIERSEIIGSIEVPSNYRKVLNLYAKYSRSLYDIGAMLFLGISLWTRNYLKIPLPKSNLWQTSGMFLCTEWVSKYLDGKEDSMITPHKLYLKLKEKKEIS